MTQITDISNCLFDSTIYNSIYKKEKGIIYIIHTVCKVYCIYKLYIYYYAI